MSKLKRTLKSKNIIIKVDNWDNQVQIIDLNTKKLIKKVKFDDHIKAMMIAKTL